MEELKISFIHVLNEPLLSIAGIGVDEVAVVCTGTRTGRVVELVDVTTGAGGVLMIEGGGGEVGRLPVVLFGTKEVNV